MALKNLKLWRRHWTKNTTSTFPSTIKKFDEMIVSSESLRLLYDQCVSSYFASQKAIVIYVRPNVDGICSAKM